MNERKEKGERMQRFKEATIKPTFQRYLIDSGYEDVVDFKEYIGMCGKQGIKSKKEEN